MPLSIVEGLGGLDEALRTFDPNIEHPAVEDDGRAFELKLSTLPRPLVLSRSGFEDAAVRKLLTLYNACRGHGYE